MRYFCIFENLFRGNHAQFKTSREELRGSVEIIGTDDFRGHADKNLANGNGVDSRKTSSQDISIAVLFVNSFFAF